MQLGREVRHRRHGHEGAAEPELLVQVEAPDGREHLGRALERVEPRPRDDERPDRMQVELERRHGADGRPRTANRPEEIRVLVRARPHEIALGRDELDGAEAVDREAEARREPADPAAERQPGESGVRDGACRDGEPVCLRGLVELAEQKAGADACCPRRRIDLDGPQPAHVDDEAVLGQRAAGHAVAARPHGQRQPVVPRVSHRPRDRGCVVAARDQRGPAVEGAVEDAPRRVVRIVAGTDQLAGGTRGCGHLVDLLNSDSEFGQ